MDPLCWTMQRARPLTTPERALLQERYAAGWRGRFELYLAMAGPVVATGCHPSGDLDEVLHEVGDTAGHLGADVRAGDRAHWPQPVVAATELVMVGPASLERLVPEGVSARPLPLDLPPHLLTLVWPERLHDDGAHRWFRTVLAEVARGAVSRRGT